MKKLKHLYWDVLDFLEDKKYNKHWLSAGGILLLIMLVLFFL